MTAEQSISDFYVDVPGIDCWVRFDAALADRGIVRTVFPPLTDPPEVREDGIREIALREPDDLVLLHEALHRLIQTNPDNHLDHNGLSHPLTFDEEERLVQHITRGLWGMGWRYTPFDRATEPAQPEEERPEGWPEKCGNCGADWTYINHEIVDGFNCSKCGASDSDE